MNLPNLFKKNSPSEPVDKDLGPHTITTTDSTTGTSSPVDFSDIIDSDSTSTIHADYKMGSDKFYNNQIDPQFQKKTDKLLAKIGLKKDEFSGDYDLELKTKARFTAKDFAGLNPKEMEDVIVASIEQIKKELLDKLIAKQTLTRICAAVVKKEDHEETVTPKITVRTGYSNIGAQTISASKFSNTNLAV